jgi:hypothetical protein
MQRIAPGPGGHERDGEAVQRGAARDEAARDEAARDEAKPKLSGAAWRGAGRSEAETQRGGVNPVPSVASASAIFGDPGSGDVDGAHV